MGRLFRMDGWAGRALLIAMAVLTLAVGLCLCDDDEMANGMSVDLCRGLAAFSGAAVVLVVALIFSLSIDLPYRAYAVSLHRPDPPPKLPFLS
jgi:hypothetical protein